ncbi:MAG: hypothetical protein ACREN2_05580 [Candidatus Dormibacteria bacterium]
MALLPPPQPPEAAQAPPPAAPPQPPPLAPQPQAAIFASQTPQPAYAGVYGAPMPAPVVPRHRTGMILFAQILMILKGIFWMLGGIVAISAAVFLLTHAGDVTSLPGYRSFSGAIASDWVAVAEGLFLAFGVVLLLIGVVDIVLGVMVGRPSNVARWFNIVLNIITSLIALSGLVNALSHSQTIGGALFFAVWLGINAIIFYALAINAGSRHAFS